MGRAWLDGCGFDQIFDPNEDPMDKWRSKNLGEKRKLSPEARPLYQPNSELRIQWGEWGPEHITVPGDACGLDIDRCYPSPPDGRALLPHNIDSIKQSMLLLVVFTWFAECLVLEQLIKNRKMDSPVDGSWQKLVVGNPDL